MGGARTAWRPSERWCRCALRPGVSVASTALAHGINANLLRRWMVQYGPGAKSASDAGASASLVPVNKPPAATCVCPSSDSCIEIAFMGATIRVHGLVDTRTLRAVMDCLAQRA